MAYKKLKIICDADDVLISCNAYALQLLSQTKGQYFDISGITAWGSMGNELDERMQFFEYEEFYENQPALPGARKFLISLMEKANVFIANSPFLFNMLFLCKNSRKQKKALPHWKCQVKYNYFVRSSSTEGFSTALRYCLNIYASRMVSPDTNITLAHFS